MFVYDQTNLTVTCYEKTKISSEVLGKYIGSNPLTPSRYWLLIVHKVLPWDQM